MNTMTSAKLALALGGALLIGVGIKTDSSALRLSGIALLLIAFALRFVRKDTPE